MLLREAIGANLHAERVRQGRNLRDVAGKAPISLGYLSELERGLKDVSSETLEAVARALYVDAGELVGQAAADMLVMSRAGEYAGTPS